MIGFGAESNKNKGVKVKLQKEGIDKLLKDYKKIKKYMKSSIYEVKSMDGTEDIVSELIKEYNDNPLE
jgi:DNA-binding transcriptional regulator YhcF (GntR family)